MHKQKQSPSAKQKYVLLGIVVFVVVILDQWTKQLVVDKFRWGESLPIIPGLFDLTYVRNTGAAFGILQKAPPVFRDTFLLTVPLVILLVIAFMYYKLPSGQKVTAFALSLIMGGAIGNLIDRTRYGFVVDFLDFYIQSHHWPAFNVADSCIVVGVSILFMLSLFPKVGCLGLESKG